MRYTSDEQRRYAFRDWLQAELRRLDFYQRRGGRYLVSEFARYAKQLGARVEEVSLGRYLREKEPVLPTPESCRELARALGLHPLEVLMEAGYLMPEDFYSLPAGALSPEELRHTQEEVDQYNLLPAVIRAQMKLSLERQAGSRLAQRIAPPESPTALPEDDVSSAEWQPTAANAPTRGATER